MVNIIFYYFNTVKCRLVLVVVYKMYGCYSLCANRLLHYNINSYQNKYTSTPKVGLSIMSNEDRLAKKEFRKRGPGYVQTI